MTGWISVKDAYPGRESDGVSFIVAVRTSQGEVISETDAWHRYAKEPHGGVFHFWGEKVTHWMPLPPPPSE